MRMAADVVGFKADELGGDTCPFSPVLLWFSLPRPLWKGRPISLSSANLHIN